MLKKTYILFAVISAITVGILMWYGQSWLSSIGDPRTAYANYGFFAGLATSVLWISAVVMLLFSHGILWRSESGWAFWTTFVYFSIFTVIDRVLISPRADAFQRANFETSDSVSLNYLIAAGLLILFGALVLANQYFSLRVHDWMYPADAVVTPEAEEEGSTDET